MSQYDPKMSNVNKCKHGMYLLKFKSFDLIFENFKMWRKVPWIQKLNMSNQTQNIQSITYTADDPMPYLHHEFL